MISNGLKTFTFHTADMEGKSMPEFRNGGLSSLGYNRTEQLARLYLQQAFEADFLPDFTAPLLQDGSSMSFHLKNIDDQTLTGNVILKFRQKINNISVYGSQVLVEMDHHHNLVSIDAKMASITSSVSWAALSPLQATEIAKKSFDIQQWSKDKLPLLYYYFSKKDAQWRLVYLLKDLLIEPESPPNQSIPNNVLPDVTDVVIDAQNGEMLAQLPRIACLREIAEGYDELGVLQSFPVLRQDDGALVMKDDKLRVETYDFHFRSVHFDQEELPGKIIGHPPKWTKSGISAHQNTRKVAGFFKNVLNRDGINNKGMPYVSSVNCINMVGTTEWRNAAWFGGQIVYGQEKTTEGYRSYASALDIVAHEITHGITDSVARLEYQGESGALNESYADIFGVIISNWDEPNIAKWDWRLGEELSPEELPLRDISQPSLYNQPDHMIHYVEKELSRHADHGGIHQNCGIHNKAAYLLMNSRDDDGKHLFTKEELAYLFYLSLTKLATQDGFSESFNNLLNSAKSLFINNKEKQQQALLAIDHAFQQVGIA